MQPPSLFDDVEDSISISSNGTELLSSQGYVSLGAIPNNILSPESKQWMTDEIVQRSNSHGMAPKLFQYKHKHYKHASKYKMNIKMNKKDYASLFPKWDLLIWYFPTYYIRNRSGKTKHIFILIFCIIGLIWNLFGELFVVSITYFNTNKDTYDVTKGIFYCILQANPYIISCIRFYFFCFKFDWNLWHTKKNQNSNSPTYIQTSSSYLLNETKEFKTNLRKTLRIGGILLMIVVTAQFLFFLIFYWRQWFVTVKSTNNGLNTQQIVFGVSIAIVTGIFYFIIFVIPDLAMCIVARLYWTESYLYIKSFTNKISKMEVDDIINSDLCSSYLLMNKHIDSTKSYFYLWTMGLLLQILMTVWHTVSLYIHHYSHDPIIWITYFTIRTIIFCGEGIFVLWPAMKMTEKIHSTKIIINDKLHKILKTRLHFHDECILSNLMNAVVNKQNNNNDIDMKSKDNNDKEETVAILWKSISSHSKQESALEILTRLKYLMSKYSSSYELLGVEINRWSIRDFIIAVIVTNILSYMWDSIDST